MDYQATVYLDPVPFKRVRTNKGRFFNDAKYEAFKQAVAGVLLATWGDLGLDKPMALHLKFYRKTRHHVDIDNLAKSIMDALQGCGVIVNDSLIVELSASKQTGCNEPRTEIKLTVLED